MLYEPKKGSRSIVNLFLSYPIKITQKKKQVDNSNKTS